MPEKQKWGKRGEWYVVIQFFLFAAVFFLPWVTPDLGHWPEPWNLIGTGLGLLLAGVGLLLALAGVISLGRSLTAVPYPKEDASLVEHGPFKVVRHPIYSGIIMGSLGWGLATNSLITLLMALLLFLFFDIKSRREEQWLQEKYTSYSDYQSRVRKLIPLIY